jgi:hypothetical protein
MDEFMLKKHILRLFILWFVSYTIWSFSGHYVTKHQLNHSTTTYNCGYFEKYYIEKKPRSGKSTYLYIKGDNGRFFTFKYNGHFHKKMSYIETDLKEGQKLCFDYFTPFFKSTYGETLIKSIKLIDNE